MLVLFVGAGNSIPHDIVQRRGRKKTFLWAGEKSLWEDYTSPADDIIKWACTEKKRKGGCKKDGIRTGDGKAVFEWAGICFNASVMATDGLNPPAGQLSSFFSWKFQMESTPATTITHMTKLQSTKEELDARSSVIWKAEQGEMQNPCPDKSHTLTLCGRRGERVHGGQTSLKAQRVALHVEKIVHMIFCRNCL